MKKLFCTGRIEKRYPVFISDDSSFSDLYGLLDSDSNRKKIVIVDQKVADLYPEIIKSFSIKDSYVFPFVATERNKTFHNLDLVAKRIFSIKPSRNDIIVIVGGGLVMNLGGLTSTLVMRGMPFCYIPTTLAGQIDACIGSKQAVNFNGAKNWIGTYNDPDFCYINPNFLKTLTTKELNSEAVEGIKLSIATNRCLFNQILAYKNDFASMPFLELSSFVEKMILAKLSLVKEDLMENRRGLAMLYGHTVGHAIEMSEPDRFSHGEAVGLGMLVAAKISYLLGISDERLFSISHEIFTRLHLPVTIPYDISTKRIEELLPYNKRNYNGNVNFVLLKDVGVMAFKNRDYLFPVTNNIITQAINDCR